MDEQQLIKDCLKGDVKAQKRFYDTFAPRMYGVCLRYANDADTAKDYLQEAFIRVFNHLGQYRFEGSLEGWVRRVVVNTALEKLRKNDVLRNTTEIEVIKGMTSQQATPVDQISERELLKLIQSLPPGFRTVFNLFAIEGYSHQEIGNMLNISEGTSKSQYARARQWLMMRLGKKDTDNDERG
ncbi:MAG TPA: RNA polymerase sigma factor [Bacteroidales bacterium]|nr:RNA polymerase sigma factor [Bacteroidales bacterium]